jgi:hypothetical protein
MASHLPPVPPEQRSNKGTGESAEAAKKNAPHGAKDVNTAEQDRQGNTHQNTTNTGYQQDR